MSKKIRLKSTGINAKGKKTGTFRTTRVPDRGLPNGKLKIKKFDPRAIHPESGNAGAHVMFEEDKIK